MLSEAPVLTVYSMGVDELQLQGIIQDYTSLSYNPKFDDVGTFELSLPFSKSVFRLISASEGLEKIIHIEDGICGICQKITCSFDAKSETIKVKGMLGEGILENSIIGSCVYEIPSGIVQWTIQDQIEYDMPNSDELNETLWEAIVFQTIDVDASFMPISDDEQIPLGQSTFGEYIRTLCKSCNKGYKVRLDTTTRKLIFSLSDYTDRSDSVWISQNLMSLSKSKFSINSQPYKNKLMVWSQFELNGVTKTISNPIDYDEPEKIPDTKNKIRADYIKIDIASDRPISSMVDAYLRMNSKGKQALYEAAYVKSYDTGVEEFQTGLFQFNRDYYLGDIVTVNDTNLDMEFKVKLLEYTKTIDLDGTHFDPTFGVSQPTLNAVLKKQKIIR